MNENKSPDEIKKNINNKKLIALLISKNRKLKNVDINAKNKEEKPPENFGYENVKNFFIRYKADPKKIQAKIIKELGKKR